MTIPDYYDADLLNIPEGKTFDRKSSEYDLNKLANILIAFANADGGTVALGIKDKKYEGMEMLSTQKQNDIEQIGTQRIVPTIELNIVKKNIVNTRRQEDEVWLISVKPSADKLYSNRKDDAYLRIGDETHKITFDERKNIEFDKGIRAFESQIVEDAILQDLDEDTLKLYKEIYGFDGNNVWDLLFPKGLAKRTIRSDGSPAYKLTVAGVLLLAKLPTTFLPGARIRFIRYEGRDAKTGTDMNIVKQAYIEGPLTKMLEAISDELESQLRTFSSLDKETGRFIDIPEYPKGAWLEGIVNAVTHRNYKYTGDDIRILMFDDRLEIHSPGSFPAVVTTNNIRRVHYSRNPYIARALTDFGWVREFGEGVDRIYKDMNSFFLDDPVYNVDSNSVNLILKNNIVVRTYRKNNDLESRIGLDWGTLNYIERGTIEIAYEHGTVKTREVLNSIEGSSATSVRRGLKHLVELNILRRVATSVTSPNQYYELIK